MLFKLRMYLLHQHGVFGRNQRTIGLTKSSKQLLPEQQGRLSPCIAFSNKEFQPALMPLVENEVLHVATENSEESKT